MAYGLQIFDTNGLLSFDSSVGTGWRMYEGFLVEGYVSGNKDYTGLIGDEFEVFAVGIAAASYGGFHTVSVSGHIVSWVHTSEPITVYNPTLLSSPTQVQVFFR